MRVKLFALLVVLLAATGCGVFGGGEKLTVTAQFRDSVGLYVGNDVTILGIKVGSVTRIEPRGTHVVVDLEVDTGTRIPANAGAVTLSPSVVTDRRVELTPVYRDGPTMRDGDLIPLARTRTPVEIDRVIRAVDQLAAELSKKDGGPGAVDAAIGIAADSLGGNGERIRTAVEALSGAMDVGVEQRDALLGLVRKVDTLVTATAKNDATIRSFSTNLTELTELLAAEGPQLGSSLETLSGLLDEVDKLVRDNRVGVENSLGDLRTTMSTVSAHTRELAESADVLPLLFGNLVRIANMDEGYLRSHVNIDEVILDGQALNGLCQRIGVQLPGCNGRLAEFGPDLGLTELLLGVAR